MSTVKPEINMLNLTLNVVPCNFSLVANVHKAAIMGLSFSPLKQMGVSPFDFWHISFEIKPQFSLLPAG